MQSTTRNPSSASAPVASSAKPRGWWSRNWKRLFLSLFVLAILAAGGGYFYKFGLILISDPYHQAMAQLRQSADVKKLLGEPIKDGWFPAGSVNSDQGEARIYFRVHGPKSADGSEPKAEVSAQARLVTGTWGFTQFDVIPEGGQRVNLMDEIMGEQPPDVPRFDPKAVQQPLPKTQAIAPPDVNIQIPDLPSDASGK